MGASPAVAIALKDKSAAVRNRVASSLFAIIGLIEAHDWHAKLRPGLESEHQQTRATFALVLGMAGDKAAIPVLKRDGRYIPNPRVITDTWLDSMGAIVHGQAKSGDDLRDAKETIKSCETDFTMLDARIDALAYKLALTVPDCTTKTLESLRKHKLEHWDKNHQSNRAWLSLNMVTEGKAGFPAFHYGPRGQRVVGGARLDLARAARQYDCSF